MGIEEIKSLVNSQIPNAVLGEDLGATPQALIIGKDELHRVCELLHTHEATYFDSLSCLTALDNGEEVGTMEVIYNLYSIPKDLHLMLKVTLDRVQPVIDTVSDIWQTANWHEREAYDLFGIQFNNHPELRRILLPKDWEGHPLRKDYVEQGKYHGMNVAYDRSEEMDNEQ